ncbi:MAG: hypothetical protein VYC41_01065 [Planctomycetota bacterium]|nr:hypothetical protein [Planctomycetota bacterium]
MRIAQYQLVTAVFIAALAPTPAVHAADGLTGVSSIRALADDRTLGASQEATISRFAEEAGRALSARNPSEDHLEAVRIDLMAPLSGGCTPAFARAYGARLLEAFGEYDNDSRTPQQQMIAFAVLSATGSSASLLDLADRIMDLDSETAAWKPMAMCQTLSQGVAKATTLDLAERNRSDLARIFGRIASRVSPSANRHVMEGFVMLGGGEREDIARRWADALKSLASREALAAEDLLCMEGATVKLRSVLLNPANRETRDAREAAARALAPALLAFHARAADHLDGDGPNTDRLRAHLGRVDQVLPFLDVRGVSLGALWDAKDSAGLSGVSSN